jgi:hypothetical protein
VEATVSAGLVSGLIEFATAKGADRDGLIKRAGISAHRLKNPDHRIPFRQYTDLMRAAQAVTGNPALALHYGEQVGMSEVSVLGLIMEASATMGEAFLQLQRYGRLATEFVDSEPGPRVMLMPKDGKLYMVFNRSHPNDFPEMTEESFARLVCGPRRFLDQPHVLAIHVSHPAPSYRAEYDRVFQCPVHFSAGWNAMELHPELAGWKVAQNPRYVFGLLTQHADKLLAELDANRTQPHPEGPAGRIAAGGRSQGRRQRGCDGLAPGLQPPDPVPQTEGRGHHLCRRSGWVTAPAGRGLSARRQGLDPRDGLSGRVFGAGGLRPRLQALDGPDPWPVLPWRKLRRRAYPFIAS